MSPLRYIQYLSFFLVIIYIEIKLQRPAIPTSPHSIPPHLPPSTTTIVHYPPPSFSSDTYKCVTLIVKHTPNTQNKDGRHLETHTNNKSSQNYSPHYSFSILDTHNYTHQAHINNRAILSVSTTFFFFFLLNSQIKTSFEEYIFTSPCYKSKMKQIK